MILDLYTVLIVIGALMVALTIGLVAASVWLDDWMRDE